MAEGGDQFDRRFEDVNVKALAIRLTGIESRVEVLEKSTVDNTTELKANTNLTKQVHEAVFGKDEGKGVQQLVEEMYAIVEMGKGFFAGISRWGARLASTSDWISKTIKRFWWVIFMVGAGATYVKTGKFPEIPLWPT